MNPADPGKRMIKRLIDGWNKGVPILKLSHMAGLSTERTMETVQAERQRVQGGKVAHEGH